MRSALLLFLATSAVVAFAQQWISPSLTSPVLMWSNKNAFALKNEQKVDVLSANNVESILSDAFKANPEVVVVFVEPHLRTEQLSILADAYQSHPTGGAFSHLKSAIENSVSSVVVPYVSVQTEESLASEIVSGVLSHVNNAKVIVGRAEGSTVLASLNSKAQTFTLQQLSAKLNDRTWDVLSNGVVDVVVVCFNAPAAHLGDKEAADQYKQDDAFVGSVVSALQQTSYVAVFTADKPVADIQYSFPASSETMKIFEERNIQGFHQNIYFFQAVSEALVVMVPFLIILTIGVACTCGVQSELKFDAEKSKKY